MRLCVHLFVILLAGLLTTAESGEQPNVIAGMADDISARDFPIYESTNCYGQRGSTPEIDRLVNEGCYLTTA